MDDDIIDSFINSEELKEWARQNGRMDDPLVQLKILEMLCHEMVREHNHNRNHN